MNPMINGGNDGIFGNDIIRIIKIEKKKQIYIYIRWNLCRISWSMQWLNMMDIIYIHSMDFNI